MRCFNRLFVFVGLALGCIPFCAKAQEDLDKETRSGVITTVAAAKLDTEKVAAANANAISAAEWFPDQTQGFARIIDFPRFVERWNNTQLGKLGKHERLKDFWQEQQKEIEGRFAEAGWQLNLKADDISNIATGQAAVGWISKPQQLQKPYAVALVVAVAEKKADVDKLLERVDTELMSRQATSKKIEYKGNSISQYTLPRGAGELVIRESLFAVVDDHLLAADDLDSLQALIDAKTTGMSSSLAKSQLFRSAMSRIPMLDQISDVEYFVRPIGLAKLLRSISGKPMTTSTDVLKVLDNQGFGKISAAVGRLRMADANFDVFHEAFVKTELPLPESVQILDFPNAAGTTIPSWVTPRASSFLAVAWNAKEAFWKVESFVDEMADQKGVFDSVIEGIETDPVGPQINIRKDVLPFVTPEIYSINEIVEPITPDSRHSLIAIRIQDPNGKLASVLERAMKNEPDAVPEDFENYRIWKVTREDDKDESLKIDNDFGNFGSNKGSKSGKAKEAADEPLLSNWAITIFTGKDSKGNNEQFLMFASHAEMIKEAITASKKVGATTHLLEKEVDVAKVLQPLFGQAKNQPCSVWQINRSDRAFEMQYELFRQDKLPQSRSMLATILDRILRPKDELKNVNQRVKGDRLPPYEVVKEFFMPGGSRVLTEPDGWSYQGFILGK